MSLFYSISRIPSFITPLSSLLPQTRARTLSGHSKWSTIKHKKGFNDAKNNLIFTKLCREITAASKACGADVKNSCLRSSISKAKAVSLRKSRITEAVARGDPTSKADNDLTTMEYVYYDGVVKFPSVEHKNVVAFRVLTLTDNRHRTGPSVRSCFAKHSGELGKSGSLDYLFNEMSSINVDFKGMEEDGVGLECVEELAIENGAEDVECAGDVGERVVVIECDMPSMITIVNTLTKHDVKEENIEFSAKMIPDKTQLITLSEEEDGEWMKLILEKFEGNDDVVSVFHNAR